MQPPGSSVNTAADNQQPAVALPEALFQASLNRVATVIATLKDTKADKDEVVSLAEFNEFKTAIQRIEQEFLCLSNRILGLECGSSAQTSTQPNCTSVVDNLLTGLAPTSRQDGTIQSAGIGDTANLPPPPSRSLGTQHNPYLTRLEKRLRKQSIQLKNLLSPEISTSITKIDVLNLHKSLLPAVCRGMERLDELTNAYLKEAGENADESLVDLAEGTYDFASNWSEALLVKYVELDCGIKSLNPTFFGDLDKFTEHSDMSIYEHIHKFEKLVADQGSKTERAFLLFSKYLHEDIQRRCIEHKDDYDSLKDFLLKRYGDVWTMCNRIIDVIPNAPPDDIYISKDLVEHYIILDAATKKVDELFKLRTVNQEELISFAFSCEFITRLFNVMPFKARNELLVKLAQQGLNTSALQGRSVYLAMKEIITMNCSVVESHHKLNQVSVACQLEEDNDQNNSNDNANPQNSGHISSDMSGEFGIKPELEYSALPRANDLANTAVVDNSAHSSPANSRHHKYPCPIENHDHEVGTCEEFMTARPETRRIMTTGKLCWSCLGPFNKCKRNCQTIVPSSLICGQCSDYGKTKGFGPLNYLMCHKDAHKVNINHSDFTSALEAYLPGFMTKKHDTKKIIGILLTNVSGRPNCKKKTPTKSPPSQKKSRTRKPNPSQKVQCINTELGKLEKTGKSRIVKETEEDSFYITQVLNILGKDVLTLYDSGASHSLIRGDLGEDLGMKVVSDESVSIRTAGGGKIRTEYGSYKASLGPTDDGTYQEITAQGINTVTSKFKKYSLSEVNKEVKDINKLPPGTVLPKYTGGADAGLLIGIEATGLTPRLLFRLPSGLGVYLSPLRDKFGSRICYGGPHPAFTAGNEMAGQLTHPLQTHLAGEIKQQRFIHPGAIRPRIPIGNGILAPSLNKD